MKIISFINNKGGTGKTTLCLNFAKALSEQRGKLITVVDADPQGSLKNWHELGENTDIKLIRADSRASLVVALKRAQQYRADVMLIDTPGSLVTVCAAALAMSHCVVVPIKPSPLDVWATYETVDLVRCAKLTNPTLKSMIVINQARTKTLIIGDVRRCVSTEFPDFKLCDVVIHNRSAFLNLSRGETVYESNDELAIDEVCQLSKEIFKEMQ